MGRYFSRFFLFCLLAAGFLPTTAAPAPATLPAGIVQGPSVEGTTQYTLENGLRVLLTPDPSKPNVTVNMTYLVGSRHENYGQTGMAHLLEHMLFRGTPSLPNALGEFSRRGLRANGSTSSDRTNYYASFAADPDTVRWYIEWQADAMINATISQEDLDAEMTVVRNEMESGENNPFQVLMQKMQSTAYQWHSYGKSVIGARSDVEQVDIKQLRQFYKLYYQPDNAVLIVSGQFDPNEVLGVVAEAFKNIPRPERTLPREYTAEPVQDGERLVVLRRQGGSPFVASIFHIPAVGDPDYPLLDLGVDMLSDTPSGRLYQALVTQKLSANVFGFARAMAQPGYAMFGAQLEPGMDARKALDALGDSINTLKKQPFTEEQLQRIKNKWMTGWNQIYADPVSLTDALSNAVGAGDWRLFFWQRDQVEQASLQAVQTATQNYLVPSNRTDGMYLPTPTPERAPQSTPLDLSALLQDYAGKATPETAEAFDSTPAAINAATLREPLSLPNGKVQMALLPKATRGDQVQATLLIQFGDADMLKGNRAIAQITADMLDRGTDELSRLEIEDRFNALQADVSFGGGAGNLAVHITTIGKNLPAVVQAVLDVIRHANFPADQLAEYQRQASASIQSSMDDPSSLASLALARHGNPWPRDDVRYVPTFEERLENITAISRPDLVRFHKEFYGAGTIRFAAVGAFEPAAVREAITKGLSGWQTAPAYARVNDPYHPIPAEHFTIETPDKANAFYLASLPLKLQDTDPRYPALYLANYLLGASETSRLWNRVRVQDGLSYTVRSQFDASSYEPSGSWGAYAIFAPESKDRLLAAMDEVFTKVLAEGFTEQEVKEGIEAVLKLRRLARTRDGVLASAWINYLQLDRSFEWSAKMDEALAALTADQVNEAMRSVLKPENFSTATAGDFKKK
ncbi:MAG TPA: pitrilysin family protein [Pusillimonas sp.]|uniref:M16 family metallopeptidase n=1 Tax=Pusillimonas sp. TaxID=3040095 RepID=UPI002C3A28AA|nr:pitrilysin family protein [Pusillimonas sp.]HUH87797.1 pitrilysin family protein [Pusillimonas sp.]